MSDIYKRKEYEIESEHENYLDNGNMQEIIDFLISEITPDDIFIDVGAHIGCVFIEVVDRAKPYKSYAFEPTAMPFELLVRNCKRNLRADYALSNMAVMDYKGEVSFFEADWGSPSNTTVDRFLGRITPKKVACIDLNSLDFGDRNLVLKIDAELSEPKIWLGMTKHIPKIKAVAMEWFNQAFCETSTPRQPLLNLIRSSGFGIYDINRSLSSPITDNYILSSGKIDLVIKR